MTLDLRAEAARYYDLRPNDLGDLPFYIDRLPRQDARVLELGCGTGRISIPLVAHCRFLHGLDLSEAMLALCREKMKRAGLGHDRILVQRANITDFDLGAQFDLIIAPFRVIQNLETDAQLAGLLRCIRAHLVPEGRAVLNVFHPNRPRDELLRSWTSDEEKLAWEVEREGGRMTCHDVRRRLVKDPLILYPELIYRTYRVDELVDKTVLPIPMRVFYPDEFLALIRSAGFTVTGTWGGYAGEPYGEGNELVVELSL